ncbi:uncharacterized protein LOC141529858, partial [Cotesia typhae]|uniref:uncharacterized protein LOC141529858 n=1 Tax=Cotesia typhae TaxID=2053667 RepID=UPI003D68C0A4
INKTSSTTTTKTVLTAGRRRKRAQQTTTNSRTPSPDTYIDLTVDSPVFSRQRKQSSTNKSNPTSNNIGILDNTIIIDDSDTSPASRPPRPVRLKRINQSASNSGSSVGGSTVTATTSDTATGFSTDIASTVPDVIELKDHDAVKNEIEKCKTKSAEPASAVLCPICFEELLNTSLKAMSTKCGHIFCENCIVSFLSSKKKCPVCMAPVTRKGCIRLHL